MSKPRRPTIRPSSNPPARAASNVAAPSSEQARLRILAVIGSIPSGEVACYGEVAMRASLPGRARLVARLLSGNDDPQLPWHRVLRSDGRIALPEGSSGYHEQCRRLRCEGVAVERGRVRRASAAQTLDAAVWGPS
ncbi:MGMT family protein [Xanthomonas populi]|uniref:Cysteine methyltransferase n=1 Tax=Xanthomonas populi TaxID=53414 RepID=A0A2S7ELM2_9XANT|nr:MGMT family protein [Xanthomonas populi]PPU91135.1 cysteine methyltransferase [Xanthomonas populi]